MVDYISVTQVVMPQTPILLGIVQYHLGLSWLMKQYSKILKETLIALGEEGIVPIYLYHIEFMCVIGIYKHTQLLMYKCVC